MSGAAEQEFSENASAFLAEEKKFAQTLLRLGDLLSQELDLQRLVQLLTDEATRLVGAEFGCFFYSVERKDEGALLLYTVSGCAPDAFANFPMPRKTAVFGPTLEGREIIRSGDITRDSRYGKNSPYYGMPKGHLPVKSYLSIPVISRSGIVLGALFFGHSQPNIFTDWHERVLTALSTQAATAIDNARLYQNLKDELEEKNRVEKALRDSEESLRTSKEEFEILAQTVPQLVWMIKPDGEVEYFNERWCSYTGATLAELQGEHWRTLLHPEEAERVGQQWRLMLTTGESIPLEFRLRGRTAEYRWFLFRAVALRDHRGTIYRWVGTCTDIEDQKRIAEEKAALLVDVQQAWSQAERESRLKDQFLATLSHELRTPLNAILGWSQLLRRRANSLQEVERAAQIIESNTRVQVQLIEDLLDMSRIISGKLVLQRQPLELASVIGAAVQSVQPSAETKEITIKTVFDEQSNVVLGDRGRIQQILWNLLSNAVKFTPRGGNISVTLERSNSLLEITIADSGIGIKPDFLPFIFDRFRQADSSTTRKYSGLGLGLSIVKQLVELHEGEVRAKSLGEGKGATFTVRLPAFEQSTVGVQERPSEKDATALGTASVSVAIDHISLCGMRVLVVDDVSDSREVLQQVLQEHEARVSTASCAAEALLEVQRNSFDLIISDIGMPDMDGYELMRELRVLEAKQGKKTPAIALTAFARSEDRTHAALAGYQAHIAKPVEPSELIAVIGNLTGRV